MGVEAGGARWQDRKIVSGLLRVLVFVIPIVAAILAARLIAGSLWQPIDLTSKVLWWVAVLGGSTLVMWAVDALASRLLPLAVLLRINLLFPDTAPPRIRVLRRAGSVNRLSEALAEARELGEDDLATAAEHILALAAALNTHDRRTRGHAERVRVYTDLIAEQLGMDQAAMDRLRWAALLHDVGKLEVHPDVLNKPGIPTDEEWEVLRRHPVAGAEMVAPLANWLGDWVLAVGEHHEKYDGTGYPRGIAGQQISMAARVVAVADVYDVITSARSYKQAMSAADARKELARGAGTHFDPAVIRAFLKVPLSRLRWAMGPIAWLGQVPVVAREVVTAGTAAAAVTTMVVAGGLAPDPGPPGLPDTGVASGAIADSSTSDDGADPADDPDGGGSDAPDTSTPTTAESTTTATAIGASTTLPGDGPSSTTEPGAPPTTNAPPPSSTTTAPPATSSPTTAPTTTSTTSPTTTTAPTSTSTTTTIANSAPVAAADTASTDEDAAVNIDVLANDIDPDGDGLDVDGFDTRSASGGTVSCAGAVCAYTPVPDFFGVDTFSYTAGDGRGGTASATVTVTVAAVPDAPVAVADVSSVVENSTVIIFVLENDSDADGEELVITGGTTGTTSGGSVTCTTFCVYTPPADFAGTDTFIYTIADPTGRTSMAMVTITVTEAAG